MSKEGEIRDPCEKTIGPYLWQLLSPNTFFNTVIRNNGSVSKEMSIEGSMKIFPKIELIVHNLPL